MFLTSPLTALQGIGVQRRPLFERLFGSRVIDALMHLPCDVMHRRFVETVTKSKAGDRVTVVGEVISHTPPTQKGKPYYISCFDGHYFFDLVYFHGKGPYLQKILPLKSKRLITGKLERFQDRWKIVHPDTVTSPEEAQHFTGVEPVYPLTTGITNKCVIRAMKSALAPIRPLPEWLDEEKSRLWPQWHEAVLTVHKPETEKDLAPQNPARLRLAYDELLAYQVSILLTHHQRQEKVQGAVLKGDGRLTAKIRGLLPFSLTPGQESAISDIARDMAAPQQMLRLIQGDVGSGKTLVALIAMAQAVEAGFQAAILAPTDILARQHMAKLSPLCEAVGIHLGLLTGRDQGKKRDQLLEDLRNHRIDILVGTHALIQEDVRFAKLGLSVIDEQHRFGVDQRLALMEKGNNPDVLAMTATPIPRTLQLANYGDMDVSLIRDKPLGRQPIVTKVLPLSRLAEVVDGVGRALDKGSKIYWVCPLVEESEVLDLAAAVERWETLSQVFPGKVGLVHGKMKAVEKDAVMDQFVNGSLDVLVATTVIEVGVDVPAAAIMIIEHAERFGLSQLHQLRGRIGRGDQTATCLLLYSYALSVSGHKRLEIMRQTTDGFLIAEEDLKLRGGGEILGTKQSGLPRFRVADFSQNPDLYGDLLAAANKDARQICQDDPHLASPRGQALRLLLALQGRNKAAKYSRSG